MLPRHRVTGAVALVCATRLVVRGFRAANCARFRIIDRLAYRHYLYTMPLCRDAAGTRHASQPPELSDRPSVTAIPALLQTGEVLKSQ